MSKEPLLEKAKNRPENNMNRYKEKRYEFEVTVKWTQVVFEESEEKATQQLKYTFADEYDLDLTNKEIKLTKN